MTVLKALENYYRREGILSTEFKCDFLMQCQKKLPPTRKDAQDAEDVLGTFTQAKSAFVGARYGNGVPRLLFISSDPGSAITSKGKTRFVSDESRTPEGVRRLIALRNEDPQNAENKAPRLRGTNNLAFCILRKFNSKITHDCVMEYYAHTNSVKCCVNKKGRPQAPKRMLNNCRNYLPGEIKTLNPDIVITHGNRAKTGMRFKQFVKKTKYMNARICRPLNMRGFFWLHTPHPASRHGEWQKQRDGRDGGPGWAEYVEMMREFVAGTGR